MNTVPLTGWLSLPDLPFFFFVSFHPESGQAVKGPLIFPTAKKVPSGQDDVPPTPATTTTLLNTITTT
jgi:hypothetical protein